MSTGQLFCRMSLFGLVPGFLMIRLKLCIFGENTIEVILYPSWYIVSKRYVELTYLINGDVNLDDLIKVVPVKFLHCFSIFQWVLPPKITIVVFA